MRPHCSKTLRIFLCKSIRLYMQLIKIVLIMCIRALFHKYTITLLITSRLILKGKRAVLAVQIDAL